MTSKKTKAVEEPVADVPVDTVKILEDATKKDFSSVLVVGIYPDGKLDISTDRPNFPFLHYLLNRTQFELNILENNNLREVKPNG